jgi:hypothetical protein
MTTEATEVSEPPETLRNGVSVWSTGYNFWDVEQTMNILIVLIARLCAVVETAKWLISSASPLGQLR